MKTLSSSPSEYCSSLFPCVGNASHPAKHSSCSWCIWNAFWACHPHSRHLRNCRRSSFKTRVDSDRLKLYETHLQPLAAKAWGSKFLCMKRIQPNLWEVQCQVSDLGGALNEAHPGLSISGTRQAFSSATQMRPRSCFFSFWMVSCHTEAYSEMVSCSFTMEFRDKTTHVKINKSTKKLWFTKNLYYMFRMGKKTL